jgi:hypothetical protein
VNTHNKFLNEKIRKKKLLLSDERGPVYPFYSKMMKRYNKSTEIWQSAYKRKRGHSTKRKELNLYSSKSMLDSTRKKVFR